MDNKMTVFYRKLHDNKIYSVCQGEQSYKLFYDLSELEASTIYGMLIVNYNPFLLDHYEWFEVVEENGEFKSKLKEEYKNNFDLSKFM